MSEMSTTQGGQIQIPITDAVNNLPAGSIQRLLKANLGKEAVAEFVVGMDEVERKAGTLYAVNTDYMVLFDDVNLVDIVCDVYSLKFITFYRPGTRPGAGRSGGDSGAAEGRSAADGRGVAVAGRSVSDAHTVTDGRIATDGRTVTDNRTAAAVLAARPQAALNYAKRKTRKLD